MRDGQAGWTRPRTMAGGGVGHARGVGARGGFQRIEELSRDYMGVIWWF